MMSQWESLGHDFKSIQCTSDCLDFLAICGKWCQSSDESERLRTIYQSILRNQARLTQLVMMDLPVEDIVEDIACLSAPQKIISLYISTRDIYIPMSDECINSIVTLCPHLQDLILFQIGGVLGVFGNNIVNYDPDYPAFSNNGVRNALTILTASSIRIGWKC